MMCKLKGRMDKGGHYNNNNNSSLFVKCWYLQQYSKALHKLSKDGYKRGHYDVQIKCFDTYLEMMVCPLCE